MKFGEGADPHLGRTETVEPEYKISFWISPSVEEWVLITEADADEVLAWAAANAEGRHYSVWVRTVRYDADGAAIESDDVRLVGTDPPAGDHAFPVWAARASGWPRSTN